MPFLMMAQTSAVETTPMAISTTMKTGRRIMPFKKSMVAMNVIMVSTLAIINKSFFLFILLIDVFVVGWELLCRFVLGR